MNNNKGFTLIELLLVIVILALISTTIIVSLNKSRARARDTVRANDIKAIQNAVEFYLEDNNELPAVATWAELGSLIGQYITGGLPSAAADQPYGYCRESGDAEKYLVAALLEVEADIEGDIDGLQSGYGCAKCVYTSGGSCLGTPNCNDDSGGRLRNKLGPVFCLGYNN